MELASLLGYVLLFLVPLGLALALAVTWFPDVWETHPVPDQISDSYASTVIAILAALLIAKFLL